MTCIGDDGNGGGNEAIFCLQIFCSLTACMYPSDGIRCILLIYNIILYYIVYRLYIYTFIYMCLEDVYIFWGGTRF